MDRSARIARSRGLVLRLVCAMTCAPWGWACREGARDAVAVRKSPAIEVKVPARAQGVGGPVAGPLAFDLVASSGGAVLVWANAQACAHGLSVQRLDSAGAAQTAPRNVLAEGACAAGQAAATAASTREVASVAQGAQDARVVEVDAAASGGRLGAVWLVQRGAQLELRGSHASDTAEAFAPAHAIGAVDATAPSARGRVWLAAADSGQMRVAWQAPRGPCVDSPGSCSHIISQAHPLSQPSAGRGVDTREIPAPCARLLVGSVWTAGVWYDAFCAFDPTGVHPTTQVYSIRPEIFYAEALPTLADCEPLGVSPSGAGALVWGRCAEGLRAHALAPEGRRQIISPAQRSVACRDGRPVLRIASDPSDARTGLELALDAPRERLEGWLPAELAPEQGARAVFTGSRLLVAFEREGRLVLNSHGCEARGLVSQSVPML